MDNRWLPLTERTAGHTCHSNGRVTHMLDPHTEIWTLTLPWAESMYYAWSCGSVCLWPSQSVVCGVVAQAGCGQVNLLCVELWLRLAVAKSICCAWSCGSGWLWPSQSVVRGVVAHSACGLVNLLCVEVWLILPVAQSICCVWSCGSGWLWPSQSVVRGVDPHPPPRLLAARKNPAPYHHTSS